MSVCGKHGMRRRWHAGQLLSVQMGRSAWSHQLDNEACGTQSLGKAQMDEELGLVELFSWQAETRSCKQVRTQSARQWET